MKAETQHLSLPPTDAFDSDHDFAAWAAMAAGQTLLAVRESGLTDGALRDAGDLAAHELLMRLLAQYHPDDAVLSEEEHRGTTSRHSRLHARRVWIIDPLDGTREFAEPPREDWAVHVALWQDGELVAGAVVQPALGQTFHTGTMSVLAQPAPTHPRIAVSRTRPPTFVQSLADELGATLVPMGSAGVKVMSVVRGTTDAYVHAGGQYEWDSAAPVAVARAAGLFASRIDGSPLRYNQADALLPDLLVCRPELVDPILGFLAEHSTD